MLVYVRMGSEVIIFYNGVFIWPNIGCVLDIDNLDTGVTAHLHAGESSRWRGRLIKTLKNLWYYAMSVLHIFSTPFL